jgi:uroporphyrinogen decarboxylase
MTIFRQKQQDIGRRFRRLLAGEKPQELLVWLWGATPSFAVQSVGYPPEAAYNDPVKSFWAQIWIIEMFGDDGVPKIAVGGASDVTWAFGGEIKWPSNEYEMAPDAVRFPVKTEAEAQKIQVPKDVSAAGPLPLYLQFAHLQHENGLPVFPFITSPIEGARSLCGPESLCRWMLKRPELVHGLLQAATDYSVQVARYFAKHFPPENIIFYNAAPMASNQMISPKQFETFVLPYQRELHEQILDCGIRHIFCHICGEQNLNLPFWSKIPMGDPGIVSFGHEIDINTAVDYFGEQCVIAGNIEPAVIHLGTPDQIFTLCREALKKGRKAPRGYILMPGCGLPPNVPCYNVFMLKKSVEDLTHNNT